MNEEVDKKIKIIGADADEPGADGPSEQEASQVLDDLDQLRAKAEERDKFLDLLQRTKADFENYQKRVSRDMQQERKYSLRPLAMDLLPTLDNLARALETVEAESPLSKGVSMVRTQLLETLKRHEITPIESDGQPFDPNQHEAVMQQPSADHPANTVLQVVEQGYMHHDRVLRPSKVIVSSAQEQELTQ